MPRSDCHLTWSLRKPSAADVARFAQQQGRLALTYSQHGQSAAGWPAGFDVDHRRILLGTGEEVFAAARDVLAGWRQMPSEWIRPYAPPREPRVGDVVVTLARYAGLWWLNACRVVDVCDATHWESGQRRYDVAYGTLPGHAECGEERFSVVMHASGQVWYEIRAFSKPRCSLSRLAYPLIRRLQSRFARESLRRVAALVAQATAATIAPTDAEPMLAAASSARG